MVECKFGKCTILTLLERRQNLLGIQESYYKQAYEGPDDTQFVEMRITWAQNIQGQIDSINQQIDSQQTCGHCKP